MRHKPHNLKLKACVMSAINQKLFHGLTVALRRLFIIALGGYYFSTSINEEDLKETIHINGFTVG